MEDYNKKSFKEFLIELIESRASNSDMKKDELGVILFLSGSISKEEELSNAELGSIKLINVEYPAVAPDELINHLNKMDPKNKDKKIKDYKNTSEKIKNTLKFSNYHICHSGSGSPLNQIKTKAHKFLSIQGDKWNPADIFVSPTNNFKDVVNQAIKAIDNQDLLLCNNICFNIDNKFVGVSLKGPEARYGNILIQNVIKNAVESGEVDLDFTLDNDGLGKSSITNEDYEKLPLLFDRITNLKTKFGSLLNLRDSTKIDGKEIQVKNAEQFVEAVKASKSKDRFKASVYPFVSLLEKIPNIKILEHLINRAYILAASLSEKSCMHYKADPNGVSLMGPNIGIPQKEITSISIPINGQISSYFLLDGIKIQARCASKKIRFEILTKVE